MSNVRFNWTQIVGPSQRKLVDPLEVEDPILLHEYLYSQGGL